MNKPHEPVCKVFLVCRHTTADPQTGENVLVGTPTGHAYHRFPSAAPFGFFIRLTDARGSYPVEVQLVDADGEVVWADGPPQPLAMDDPLMHYDMRINLSVAFPAPGLHEFVLAVGGHPVARQRFMVGQG